MQPHIAMVLIVLADRVKHKGVECSHAIDSNFTPDCNPTTDLNLTPDEAAGMFVLLASLTGGHSRIQTHTCALTHTDTHMCTHACKHTCSTSPIASLSSWLALPSKNLP